LPTFDKIKIALIFVGEHALRNIIPALELSPYFTIIGLYFRTPEKIRNYNTDDYHIYESYKDALEDECVECVYISSPNNSHFKYNYEALANHKHVICEKPLVTNYNDFLTLKSQALKVNKCIFESFMFEYHDQYCELKNILDKFNVGKIRTLTARFGYPHLNADNIRYQKSLGGGAFLDVACYLIKTTSLLLGNDYESINSNIIQSSKYEVDTEGNCVVKFKTGEFAFLDWGMGRSYRNEIDIWTEKYRIRADRFFSKHDNLETTIVLTSSIGEERKINIKAMNHFELMFNEFFNIITNATRYESYLNNLQKHQDFYFTVGAAPK
jgi:hypothetical protein